MDYMKAAQAFGFLERQSQNYITMACTEMGVSYSEYVFLSELLDHEGIRQDDMAAILCVDKAQVTRTIKSLENKGLVYRIRSEADKRVRFVYATDRTKQEEAFMNRLLDEWDLDSWMASQSGKEVSVNNKNTTGGCDRYRKGR